MAIRVQTLGATDLRLAANIVKPNLNALRTIGGAADKRVGFWQGAFVRMPATGMTNNTIYQMWGHDGNNTALFNGGTDTWLGIAGDNAGQPTRFRPRVYTRSGVNNAFAAAQFYDFAALPILTRDPDAHLLLWGAQNTGTDAAPVWTGWAALVRVGGGISTEVFATPLGATWVSATNTVLLSQIFAARGTGSARSPVNLAYEHMANVTGDFPWDTVNNRPHHAALAALANGTGAGTLHTYATLIDAQNAGTLGYADLRANAKADLSHYWTLANVATGLTNSGIGGANTLAVTNWNALSGGLVDAAAIAPAHWAGAVPVITEPTLKFHGGRGARALVVSGTHTANVERRWVVEAGGAVVPGFDWSLEIVTAGAWQTSDVLPVGGPYRLEVRDQAVPANATSSGDWLVGTVLLTHAQSGMALAFNSGGGELGGNTTGLAVAAGAQGLLLRLSNMYGGTPTVYSQPVPTPVRMIGGATPAVGSGTVACLNAWNLANPGHPLLIANMAIEGSSMVNWANNEPMTIHRPGLLGHASWFYMGTVLAVADAVSGNNSGVVETYAALLRRNVDLHVIMWTPNMSSSQATRDAYVAAINARFSGTAATAPWLTLPPWRGHRNPPDTSATVTKREEHVLFHNERGALGILGPYWPDIVMDGNPNPANVGSQGSLHSAFANPAGTPAFAPVPDTNGVGSTRLGLGIGYSAAWAFDRTVKAHGPRVLAAWSDNSRATVQIELGRTVRTLNGAAINPALFWVSSNNGTSFVNTGFTVALDATATRAVLTPADGGAAWLAAGAGLRVDYAREWPFSPNTGNLDEANTERLLDGLLYDDQQHRGGTNFAPGSRTGNPLSSSNRTGSNAGVAVTARGAAKLVATERWTGVRNITVRMMAADGVTVLRERTFAVTGT